MDYWRITSWHKGNIEAALEAGKWGVNHGYELKRLSMGDRLAFYASQSDNGYWALGTVTEPAHVSHARIWGDGAYPHRISFSTDLVVQTAVPRQSVVAAVPGGRLKFQSQRSIIKLTED